MDTFAALALASEPPLPSVIEGPPFDDQISILSPTVWRQILGVSLWNVVVMVMLMFFGRMIGGLADYDRSTPTVIPTMPDGFFDRSTDTYTAADIAYMSSEAKVRHLTYLFNTFVFMQVFNLINCRKIGKRDFNVFESMLHNWYFIVIFAVTIVGQYLLINVFCSITSTVPLDKSEWGGCICVGVTPILISAILKLTPERWVDRIPTGAMVDENSAAANPMERLSLKKKEQQSLDHSVNSAVGADETDDFKEI